MVRFREEECEIYIQINNIESVIKIQFQCCVLCFDFVGQNIDLLHLRQTSLSNKATGAEKIQEEGKSQT